MKNKGQKEKMDTLPWERKPSIYEYVEVRTQADSPADDDLTLPDDDRAFSGSQIRWAAGAMDGVATHHMGGNDTEGAKALLNLVVDYCNAPSVENKLKVYEQVIKTRTIGAVDTLIQGLRQASGLNLNRLYELAKSFAIEATDREPVKVGISLLGVFNEKQDQHIFRTLGRHDEFTLFCAVAIATGNDDSERDLWELAQKVHGWGRVHIVERLAESDNPEIKDWLLREGYKNSVMYEYLTCTCAASGDLLAALRKESVDAELLASAGDILKTLLCRGGPAGDIDSYNDGAAAVELYVDHLTTAVSATPEFLVLAAIRDFLSSDDADWEEWSSRGWTPELRSALLQKCQSMMALPLWSHVVKKDLESLDEETYWNANQAASILGIDRWQHHWTRLQAGPLKSGRWFHAMETCGSQHIDEVVNLAQLILPLDAIAKGPGNELGLGEGYEAHQCLGAILQGLQAYPGYGTKLIDIGLKSSVISNRNLALRSLAKWGRSNWPPSMDALLANALQHEPEDKVRESIRKVINGETFD